MILIDLTREDMLGLISLRNSPSFQIFKQIIESDKIRPIEKDLLEKPLADVSEYRAKQAELKAYRAVFSYLDHKVKDETQSNRKD